MKSTTLFILTVFTFTLFSTCGTRSGSDKYYEEYRDKTLYPVKAGDKCGYINKDGKLIAPAIYEAAYSFREGMGYVKTRDSMGFVDHKGKLVFMREKIPTPSGWYKVLYVLMHGLDVYGDSFYSEGLAHVFHDGKWGFVDKTGTIVIPETYEQVNPFQEDVAAVKQNDLWGFIDKKNVMVIPPAYIKVLGFTEGLAVAATDSLFGYLNHQGEWAIPAQYKRASPFSEGLAQVVTTDKKYLFINTKGEIVKEVNDDCDPLFSEGMISFQKDTLWGFMNKNFDTIIPPRYNKVLRFTEGLAAVRTHDRLCGYIDKEGKEVITPQFDNAMIFYYDRAFVKTAGVAGKRRKAYIDKKGTIVWKESEE